ncbi:hypothetical protein CC2G_009569 [Coprinopsis cinerea AmutBmut pab1-1]|nr:hypothetical protein CC2G_009569 [Coprinopsis cinerea AmutBmut pab1-1]
MFCARSPGIFPYHDFHGPRLHRRQHRTRVHDRHVVSCQASTGNCIRRTVHRSGGCPNHREIGTVIKDPGNTCSQMSAPRMGCERAIRGQPVVD